MPTNRIISNDLMTCMQIKRRNPFIHWAIIIISFGQYAFFWPFLMARDINRISKKEVIPWPQIARRFVIVYCLYMTGFVSSIFIFLSRLFPQSHFIPTTLYWALFPLAIYLMIVFFKMLFSIRQQLLNLNKTTPPSSSLLIITTLVYMISVPLLQSSLNKTIDAYHSGAGNGR